MSFLSPKKQPASERQFEAAGKVSIWVGDFADEEALLDYIEDEQGMGADFGCVLRESRELAVEPEPLSIRELLHSFSSSKDFIDEAVSHASDSDSARCAVVAYARDYSKLGFAVKATKLRFLCVASF